jgi:hypothetical protein
VEHSAEFLYKHTNAIMGGVAMRNPEMVPIIAPFFAGLHADKRGYDPESMVLLTERANQGKKDLLPEAPTLKPPPLRRSDTLTVHSPSFARMNQGMDVD